MRRVENRGCPSPLAPALVLRSGADFYTRPGSGRSRRRIKPLEGDSAMPRIAAHYTGDRGGMIKWCPISPCC